MYSHRHRFLFALLFLVLLCSAAQATTNLLITVQDNLDNSSIPHATVYLNGGDYARTNANGQVYITHTGDYDQNVQISMSGYDDWQQTISKNATSALAMLNRKTLTLKVNLYDSDTLKPVYDARINLTSVNVSLGKQTDNTGTAAFGVNAMTLYSIFINANNYQPRSGTIDMGAENREVQYWLLPSNRFSFIITDKETKTAVSDAEIRIDDILAGKTDSRGILNTQITRGKSYTLNIVKPGYQTITDTRLISESDAIQSIEISKAPIGAFVYVFDESRIPLSGAQVYINGSLSGTTNEYGRSNFPSLVTGGYLLEVSKPGYITVSKSITVADQGKDYTFALPFESAALSILVKDKDQKVVSNASVIMNGNTAGLTDENGQYSARVKFNSVYNITAIKEGYQSASVKKQVVSGNATDSVTLVIEKNLDLGLISMVILGVIAVLILFAILRMIGHKRRRHVSRRNEI
ncbi:carboxypeptidase regulatory-like domain-containing protein [uncultured Methanoregula sp.]|uniref:carboxypeptidase regulatory-like domain-containing protein n=1 Tax=uncultured Methanoregula sp. TaxID=1005933 RepID=UPI002AAAE7FE|nr:carboxypeptidase regulatory-like domain-containing protein [uncultured Methanoregula sp.]